MRVRLISPLLLAITAAGCLEQYDPTNFLDKIEEEQTIANRNTLALNDDGTLPSGDGPAEEGIEQKFATFCASCHGATGAADTSMAQALTPRPRNFTDSAWQRATDDAQIRTVIERGGTAAGLSATMAPWGHVLDSSELDQMVQLIRGFGR